MNIRRSPFHLFAWVLLFLLALFISLQLQIPAWANLPNWNLPQGNLGKILTNDGQELVVERCVYLDGRCIFQVAAPRSEIGTRLNYIQTQLNHIKQVHNEANDPDIRVFKEIEDNLSNIMIRVAGDKQIRLMTVTRWDAELKGEEIEGRTAQIIDQIEAGLERARRERTPQFLQRQGAIASSILLGAVVLHLIGRRWQNKLKEQAEEVEQIPQDETLLSTQLTLRQITNVREVKIRLSQLLQGGAIAAALLIIPGLFPQTRISQIWLLTILKYPFRLVLIGAIAYIATRLSYAFIAKINQLLAAGALDAFTFITQESNHRLELRVNTFSQVMRSIITLIILVIALLVFLWSININVAPILAGAGLIGLAITFAAQNLLKDIINGFCIILEDQYAVGDVINVGTFSGFVENMNLRITQIRDAEGRLITIPNSEVRIVANLSNQWSRADLNIPVPYQTDIDFALQLLREISQNIREDEAWRSYIIEDPLILGVDNFNERGVVIKVWIKTIPLKQWEVAREFRRRVKIAFEAAGIHIPVIQNEVSLKQDKPNG